MFYSILNPHSRSLWSNGVFPDLGLIVFSKKAWTPSNWDCVVQLGTFVLFSFIFWQLLVRQQRSVNKDQVILNIWVMFFNEIYQFYSKDMSFSCIPYTTCLCMWYEIDDYTWLICGCLYVRLGQPDKSHKYGGPSKRLGSVCK